MEKPETEQMNLLVEAFSKGQVYFSWVPGEELLALENPYDYSEREAKGAFALFDGVYYNGYFCTCFGAAPVLVLMLPFYLLTGMYLSTMTANLIFMCMGLFLMGGLYYLLLKKFVRNISSTTYVVGYITFVVGSGFLSLLRGLMYDIAVTSAMDFIMIAILLLIVQEKKDKLKGGLLFLSGLSTGLAVLAKPNFIVYYLIILWLWYQLAHKYSIRECLLKSSYFLIPLMLCAVFQLTYNYARFGNFLEFGYNYQTGADPKIIHNSSCAAVIKGVITYLVSFPKLNIGEFPFLTMSTSVTGTGMNVVTAADKCLGLIFVPIVYPLVFYKRRGHSLKAQGDKNIEKLDVIIKISIVICMMQLFISARYASGNDEYLIDIRALLILLSITLSVLCVNTITDFKIEFLCILTIMIMLPVSLGRGVNLRYPTELNLIAKNVFEWWS